MELSLSAEIWSLQMLRSRLWLPGQDIDVLHSQQDFPVETNGAPWYAQPELFGAGYP
jgi:hypothetical protein